MNQIHHYRKYFYKEIVTSINEVKNGAFYRLYGYKYEDSGLSESYSAANTPLLLVVGKNTQNFSLQKMTKGFDTILTQYVPTIKQFIPLNLPTLTKINESDTSL